MVFARRLFSATRAQILMPQARAQLTVVAASADNKKEVSKWSVEVDPVGREAGERP